MNAHARRQQRQDQIDEFVELAAAKLGLDLTRDIVALSALKEKSDAQMAANLTRLRAMRDYNTATPATHTPPQPANGPDNTTRPRTPQQARAYAAILLRELWGEQEAAELIADLPRYDNDHISRMITDLEAVVPIAKSQIRFATILFTRKFGTQGAPEFTASLQTMTKAEAKTMLATMRTMPDHVAPGLNTGPRAPQILAS